MRYRDTRPLFGHIASAETFVGRIARMAIAAWLHLNTVEHAIASFIVIAAASYRAANRLAACFTMRHDGTSCSILRCIRRYMLSKAGFKYSSQAIKSDASD